MLDSSGAMGIENKLGEYLRVNGLTQESFAEILTAAADGERVSSSLVSQWVTGLRTPNLNSAFLIQEATGGLIPATYWRSHPGRKQRAARRIKPPPKASAQ